MTASRPRSGPLSLSLLDASRLLRLVRRLINVVRMEKNDFAQGPLPFSLGPADHRSRQELLREAQRDWRPKVLCHVTQLHSASLLSFSKSIYLSKRSCGPEPMNEPLDPTVLLQLGNERRICGAAEDEYEDDEGLLLEVSEVHHSQQEQAHVHSEPQ